MRLRPYRVGGVEKVEEYFPETAKPSHASFPHGTTSWKIRRGYPGEREEGRVFLADNDIYKIHRGETAEPGLETASGFSELE